MRTREERKQRWRKRRRRCRLCLPPTPPHQGVKNPALRLRVCTCTRHSRSPCRPQRHHPGRSCLRVALFHHLFPARLLISVLIISCRTISAWVVERRTGRHVVYLTSSLLCSYHVCMFACVFVFSRLPW